jgi:hypothetical protein
MVIMGAGERTSISGFPNPTRRFRYRVPKALLGWWGELHPGSTLQLQLPFVIERPADSGVGAGTGGKGYDETLTKGKIRSLDRRIFKAGSGDTPEKV